MSWPTSGTTATDHAPWQSEIPISHAVPAEDQPARPEVTWFRHQILAWYQNSGRTSLPWQHKPTPYRVWISEIMLQQTQVRTVIPYYEAFMHSFPDVYALAAATQDQVLHHWSGLGYYARARNLPRCARTLVDTHAGRFPTSVDALASLPGIGRSTAGAILSLALEQPAPILDGNVKRVLARYRAIPGWPGKASVSRQLWAIAETLTPITDNRQYTQAMMDLGALVCTRSQPRCGECPLATRCRAHAAGKPTDFPGRKPKTEKPERSVLLLILVAPDGRVLLRKRPSEGLWGGLYGFPEFTDRAELQHWLAARSLPLDGLADWAPFRHTFSHFHLRIHPVHLNASLQQVAEQDLWLDPAQAEVGLAAPTKKLLDQLTESDRP